MLRKKKSRRLQTQTRFVSRALRFETLELRQLMAVDVNTNLGQNEPNIVVNPNNPANVIVAQFNQLTISNDYGRTFPTTITAQLPVGLPAGYGFGGDPSMAFDANGRMFWNYLILRDVDGDGNIELVDGDDISVVVQQVNPTTGALIGNAIDVTPGAHSDDKSWLAIDSNPASPFANNIYLVWTRLDAGSTVMFSRSTNTGATYSAAADISGPNGGNGFVWPSHIAVGHNGDVYVGWHNDTNGAVNATVSILRDSTGGANMQAGVAVQSATFQAAVSTNVQSTPNAIPQTNFWTQGANQPYILVDPVRPGNVYVVVNDDPDNSFTTFPPPASRDPGDVLIFRSTNFGVTFGAPIRVDSAPAGTLQTMPNAAIDEQGNIAVSWYDTRSGNTNAGGNLLLDLYAATSRDGGLTWSNDFRINDAQFDPDLNAPQRFPGPPPTLRIGEYNGIAATNGTVFLAWTGNSGNQEVFFDAFNILAPFQDAFEPNNTLAAATALGSDPAIAINAAISDRTDRDNYFVVAHSTGSLVANLYFNATAANLRLRVRDSSGATIASSVTSNIGPGSDVARIAIPVVTGRRYYFEVFSNDAIVNPADYTLEIENFAAPSPTLVDLRPADDTGMMNDDDVTSQANQNYNIIVDLSALEAQGIALVNSVASVGATVQLVTIDPNGVTTITQATRVGLSNLWTANINAAIDGLYYVSARVAIRDITGVVGFAPIGGTLVVTKDATAPNPPTAPDLSAVSDSGMFNNDNITNKMEPTFVGTGEANSKVRLLEAGVIIGQGVVTSGGVWQVTAQPLTDGRHTITAVLEDLAGNVSVASGSIVIEIDTLEPNTPLLDLVTASDTGRHDDDLITNDNTPTFSMTTTDPNVLLHLLPDYLKFRLYDRFQESAEVLVYDSSTDAVADAVSVAGDGFTSLTLLTRTLAALPDGVHNFKLEVEDRAGNISHDFILPVRIDTAPPPVFFGLPTNATDGLHPSSDSGVLATVATLSDRATNDSTPTFWGRAEADSIVTTYLDVNNNGAVDNGDIFLGRTVAVPLDGNNQFPNGAWEITSDVDLNDPQARNLAGVLTPLPRDGVRRILVTAEDVAGNLNPGAGQNTQSLTIFIDTQGPQITNVEINNRGNTYDLFDPKPSTDGPTPLVNRLVVSVRDLPNRVVPDWVYAALDANVAIDPGHYQVKGDYNGIIPIQSIVFTPDPAVNGQPATGILTINFFRPLPDDRFTLTITDDLVDPVGNKLDGESNAAEPQEAPNFIPGGTGDGVPGGNFVARFTVDSRPEVGTWAAGSIWVDTNGNESFDPGNLDFVNRDITYNLGYTSDNIFNGNFVRAANGIADRFDKIAAYGRVGSQWRWMIDVNNDGAVIDPAGAGPDVIRVDPANVNGTPVAGRFDINDANGDEVGLFTGTSWWFDTNHDFNVDRQLVTSMRGLPVVGDFNGDGFDDLATWADDRFQIDFAKAGRGSWDGVADVTFNFGFIGTREVPVAADMDQDGTDDIGLWTPDRSGVAPLEGSEWYIIVSDGNRNYLTTAAFGPGTRLVPDPLRPGLFDVKFTPVPFGPDKFIQFGDEFALPLLGNFDPPVTTPATGTDTNPNDPLDVNNDGQVSPIDALLVVDYLNKSNQKASTSLFERGAPYLDTSRDKAVSPIDALLVIDFLNTGRRPQGEAADAAIASMSTSSVSDDVLALVAMDIDSNSKKK